MFAYVTSSAAAKGRCVYLLAHRAELVKQIAMTLARFGCQHRIVAPGAIVRQCQVAQFKALGRSFVGAGRVYVCSAQTLVKRLDEMPDKPDIIVIDEAHHLTLESTWGRCVEAFPEAKLLPVTATPIRLDGKGLGLGAGGFADTMILGPTMRELIDQGFLSPYRIFAPPNALDLSGVRTRAGDYAKEQLAGAMDKPTITGDAVQHYHRLAAGKRAVAFCVSVDHAKHVAEEFRQAGVPAEFLDGTLDPAERQRIIERFEVGQTLVLSSCDIVSEGFDLPAIEVAILLRPTQSLALYLQQVGRALRVFPGKAEAIILDHVGAVATHGLPDEEREWSLDGVKRGRRQAANDNEPGVDRVMTCPKCYTIHLPAAECPTCGHVYPAKARKIEQADGELQELQAEQIEALRRQKRVMQGQAQTVEQLMAQGMSRPRAQKVLQAREAKQALIGDVLDAIEAVRAATGRGPYAALGVTLGDVRRMKPKELQALLGRARAMVPAEAAA
ncbi:MAG: DEAD/DEAH box helicase [Burkholderiaceae bacterium]|nr:DEAD/DEAH box helicase [Burkholderiaceae bacterium]